MNIEKVPLGKHVKVEGGFAFQSAKFSENGIPIIRISNIIKGKIDTANCVKYPKESFENFKRYEVKEGDILIAMSGATTGKVGVVRKIEGKVLLNQRLGNFKIKNENNLLKEFLYRIVQSPEYQKKLKNIASGCAQPNISAKQLESIEVTIPPLPTQKKIVAILEKAEKLKGWRREADELTDEFLKSTFLEMFGDPVRNPMGWCVKKIKEVIVDIQAGWSVNGESKPRLKNEFAVLKVSAVTSGVFLPNECKVINEKDLKKIVTPEKRDVLFSRANTLELVGATCLITENYPFLLLPDKLWKIKVEKKYILPEYLKFVLSHSAIRKKISALSTGTSGSMYNISMKKFSLINITVPPIEIQDEFVKIVEKDEQIRKYQIQSSQHIEDLFNALMQQAFRGELT